MKIESSMIALSASVNLKFLTNVQVETHLHALSNSRVIYFCNLSTKKINYKKYTTLKLMVIQKYDYPSLGY